MTPGPRHAVQIAETDIGVLRVDAARLEGILADPAHRSAAEVAAVRLQKITCLLADLDEARAELEFLCEVQEVADDALDTALAVEFRASLEAVTARLDSLRRQIPGEFDEREAVLTIEASSYEGMRWGTDLLHGYVAQAEHRGRRVQIYSESVSMDFDLAVTLRIGGPDAFGWLKGERAVHRLARKGGRPAVDARVEVLAAAVSYDKLYVDEDDVEIFEQRETSSCGGPLPDDVRAVRLRHLSTGTTAWCSGQGATHRNRTGAWTWLRARLLHLRQASAETETHDRFLGGSAGTVTG